VLRGLDNNPNGNVISGNLSSYPSTSPTLLSLPWYVNDLLPRIEERSDQSCSSARFGRSSRTRSGQDQVLYHAGDVLNGYIFRKLADGFLYGAYTQGER